MTLDYSAFDVLTFDCYGTLIDWEAGILAGLHDAFGPALAAHDDESLLSLYSELESAAEVPYQRYRAVLATCARRLAERLSLPITEAGVARFSASVRSWPAFADSHDALLRLQSRYQLAVITNCDDDLFAASSRRLGIWFDWVVTALQAGSYKPDPHNFHVAFERIGVPPERILHVAQSLFHDHAAANRLGLTSVWINRRAGRPGTGATPPTDATPAAEFPSLAAFADTVVA